MDDFYDVNDNESFNEVSDNMEPVETDISFNQDDITDDINTEADDIISQYQENGYTFEINDLGQTVRAYGDLHLGQGERDLYAQRTAGGEFRTETDEGGHLIASRFEGPGGPENLVPENRTINRGPYKTMENNWAKELKDGNEVNVDITPIYHGDSLRPDIIMGKTEVTDSTGDTVDYFSITNEDLESDQFEIPEADSLELFDSFPNAMDNSDDYDD